MSLFALQDLFRQYREKATGVWTLGKDPGRTIFIDYGDTVFAQSTHLQDRLTYILVERGKLTQAQMDYALANLKPGLSIGKNLIEMGFITQRDLLEVAKAQVERIVRGAFTEPDLVPSFQPRELDANVVRLPMNTPQLFLAGTLALQDREGLLELLGPLNQVVVLQGRSLMDLTLPPDLAKLPPLLDGTHTLLELSRESMAEPLRLGAFALFLREMGWARLHEMPPLDHQALEVALAPEPEPLSLPLAEPFPETVPSLFSTIQEAARPTTNLEHLSLSLDEAAPVLAAPEGEAMYLPEAADGAEPAALAVLAEVALAEPPAAAQVLVAPGEGYPATPPLAIQAPFEPEEPIEPAVTLRVPAEAPVTLVDLPGPAAPAGRGRYRILLALAVLALIGGGTYAWRLRTRSPRPAPAAPAAVAPVPAAAAPAPAPVAPVPAPPAPAAAMPAPVPKAPAPAAMPAPPVPKASAPAAAPAAPAPPDTSLAARLKAMEQGDLPLAVSQGRQLAKEVPPGHWTLRLEIACQGETIRHVAELFKGRQPDLFLRPLAFKDGRVCYQVFLGRFPTEKAAENELKQLPASFLAERNRPKLFRFSELPSAQ